MSNGNGHSNNGRYGCLRLKDGSEWQILGKKYIDATEASVTYRYWVHGDRSELGGTYNPNGMTGPETYFDVIEEHPEWVIG